MVRTSLWQHTLPQKREESYPEKGTINERTEFSAFASENSVLSLWVDGVLWCGGFSDGFYDDLEDDYAP